MERLEFAPGNTYSALEASIHTSRYLLARSACAGKRVLDAACGEGYGSSLMSRWGATSVAGLDISADAIARARALFSGDHIGFTVGDAQRLSDYYEDHSFDLVVSLETFEHVEDPVTFLEGVQRVLAPGGTVIVSCPNDHWYYSASQSNPFHRRKYRFEEFRQVSEAVLGPARWYLGCLAAGYTAVALDQPRTSAGQIAMMEMSDAPDSIMLPVEPAYAPTPEQSAHFVGVWGPAELDLGAAVAPYSLDAVVQGAFAAPATAKLRVDIEHWQAKFQDGSREIELLKKQRKHWQMNAAAAEHENTLLREALYQCRQDNAALMRRLAAVSWRMQGIYRRVRAFTPLFVLRSGAYVIDQIRQRRGRTGR